MTKILVAYFSTTGTTADHTFVEDKSKREDLQNTAEHFYVTRNYSA